MTITLEYGPWFTFVIRSQTGETRLIQFGNDFPGVAQTFGWSGDRDGGPDSLRDACEYLAEHVGVSVDDPGYF